MDRIAVIGNSCGGKSRLSRRLAARHDLPCYEIDEFLWRPDFNLVSPEAYNAKHFQIIGQDRWLMDGLGAPPSLPIRLSRATMIILVDLPLWVHFWFACERQMAWTAGRLEHPPGGLPNPPPTEDVFRAIGVTAQKLMPELRALCKQQRSKGKQLVVIKSLAELDAFELDAARLEPAK